MAATFSWFIPVFFGGLYLAPCIAMTHGLVGLRMRAMGSAVLFFVLNLIGLGLGPWLTGIMSDLLTLQFGDFALRYAMSVTVMVNVWCAFHYYKASKTIREDLSRAPE
jgi:hypothetical protein